MAIVIIGKPVLTVQHEAKMKSVAESLKEVDAKKRNLQEQVDQLTEDCARLKAQGRCSTWGRGGGQRRAWWSIIRQGRWSIIKQGRCSTQGRGGGQCRVG